MEPIPVPDSVTASGGALPVLRRFRWRRLFFGLFLLLFLGGGLLVWSFVPGGEVRTMRRALDDVKAPPAKTKIAFGVGWPALGLARLVTAVADVEADARLALRSVRRADVSVLELERELNRAQRLTLLESVDRSLERKGWERIVGVLEEDETVGVYLSTKSTTADDLRLAVLVLSGRELVSVAVRCDVEPLIELVGRHAARGDIQFGLAH